MSVLTNRSDISLPTNSYDSKIDSLNIELKHIKKDQLILDKKISSYRDSIFIYDSKIDSLSKEITKTRIYYGKKINDIRNYTPSQLDNFFTDRYK